MSVKIAQRLGPVQLLESVVHLKLNVGSLFATQTAPKGLVTGLHEGTIVCLTTAAGADVWVAFAAGNIYRNVKGAFNG